MDTLTNALRVLADFICILVACILLTFGFIIFSIVTLIATIFKKGTSK